MASLFEAEKLYLKRNAWVFLKQNVKVVGQQKNERLSPSHFATGKRLWQKANMLRLNFTVFYTNLCRK